jgi:putative membrane protein
MPTRFDDAALQRITDAVRALEARSAAELVVEIRARSGSYAHADARFAAFAALLSLVVLVFMPWVAPPLFVIFVPIVAYAGALVVRLDFLRRWFTSRRERAELVRTQAAALFHDRGIANTSGETGAILYASVLEQRMELLADRGLLGRVEPHEWNALLGWLHEERTIDPDAIVAAIERLAPLLERAAPAGASNADELRSTPGISF